MSPITLLDASAVAFVVAVVGEIRSQYRIPDRFVPLIPVLVAQLVALLVVYISKNGEVGKLPVFLVTCMWEGVKTAALAMSAYKIGKTTVLNSDSSGPMEARRDDLNTHSAGS